MKKIYIAFAASLFLGTTVFSQTYNSPESIEFDYANNRWLIANTSGGNILARNSANGAMSVFTSLPSSPYGVEIVGSTLYVCDQSNHVKGYDLTSASQVMNITVTGATFLNGITHDNNGNLFVTDFSAKRIYRINIATQQYNIFVTGLAKSPNGIIFDQPNNRCVFVNWGTNAPIMSVNLADSTTSTLTTTSFTNIDGIASDGAGTFYIATWGSSATTGAIQKYTSFASAPTTVVTGLNHPADIFYNVNTDTLGVPNSGTSGGTASLQNNTTYHYFGSATGVTEVSSGKLNVTVHPNPVIKAAEINYELPSNGKVLVELYDIKGALVKTIVNEEQAKGKQTTFFSRSTLAPGTYLLKIETETFLETKRIIIAE